jgi:hypothetical protein
MSGTLPRPAQIDGLDRTAHGAPSSRLPEDAARARRAACHRAAGDAASAAVLEVQAAPCGVAHRHFDRRRHAEAQALKPDAAQDRAMHAQDADIAPGRAMAKLLPMLAWSANAQRETSPSALRAAPLSRLARTWASLVSWLAGVLPGRSGSARNEGEVRPAQPLSALGFREFTVPRRTALGAPSTLRTKSAGTPRAPAALSLGDRR